MNRYEENLIVGILTNMLVVCMHGEESKGGQVVCSPQKVLGLRYFQTRLFQLQAIYAVVNQFRDGSYIGT